ncbi:unnamed protein product [Rotaria sp. Silwood1]|nr:unnamed protein product [Rotaria sp. Silwood1]
MCDDLMRKLMKKLNMLIPEWELHRRINITIKQQIVSIIGLDLNQDYAYTLFSTVRILVKQNTQTIYDSKLIKETSFDHARQADVCLVLGSSLRVTPTAHIPMIAALHVGKLAIGNFQ